MSTSQSPAAALSPRAPAAPAASPDWHTLPQVDQDREAFKLLLALATDVKVAPQQSERQQVLLHAAALIGERLLASAVQHTPAVVHAAKAAGAGA